jgi:hypothetical protein
VRDAIHPTYETPQPPSRCIEKIEFHQGPALPPVQSYDCPIRPSEGARSGSAFPEEQVHWDDVAATWQRSVAVQC